MNYLFWASSTPLHRLCLPPLRFTNTFVLPTPLCPAPTRGFLHHCHRHGLVLPLVRLLFSDGRRFQHFWEISLLLLAKRWVSFTVKRWILTAIGESCGPCASLKRCGTQVSTMFSSRMTLLLCNKNSSNKNSRIWERNSRIVELLVRTSLSSLSSPGFRRCHRLSLPFS